MIERSCLTEAQVTSRFSFSLFSPFSQKHDYLLLLTVYFSLTKKYV